MEKRKMSTKRSAKRTVAEMRKEMVENGGVFLDWSAKIKSEALNSNPETKNAFETISQKGFLVFETGCILPHPYYSKKGKDGPARFRGDKASLQIFQTVKKFDVQQSRNEDGWPTMTEITHLCHWNACMNPHHLIYEPRWKNWKRLYCFGCDCNVEPPCLAKFHPQSYWEDEANWPAKVGYHCMAKLKQALPDHVKVLPKSHYDKEDLKANNKFKRLKRKRKHDRQTKRKLKSK